MAQSCSRVVVPSRALGTEEAQMAPSGICLALVHSLSMGSYGVALFYGCQWPGSSAGGLASP